MNDNAKRIIKRMIIGFVITILFSIAFQLYYGNVYTAYIGLIGAVLTIVFSKAYLLPFANLKIEGTVTKSNVKTFYDRKLSSSASGRAVGSTRTAIGYRYSPCLKIVVSIRTVRGGWFRKAFRFEGEEDEIPVGTRIRFTILDDKPEIVQKFEKEV